MAGLGPLLYMWRGRGIASLGLLGFALIIAGFKVWRDAGDPTIPAALRPSSWHAVAAWVLGFLVLVTGFSMWHLWW